MSLRRAALARKSELRRGAEMKRAAIVRRREFRSRSVKSTRPPERVRNTVAERAGYCCERCGRQLHDGDAWTQTHSFHHRLPRGRGGRNTVSNLVLLCGSGVTGCHGQVEDQRAAAYDSGWLVETGLDPATKPVLVHDIGHVLLTEDGDYQQEAAA